jgi:molecular chaperone HscA
MLETTEKFLSKHGKYLEAAEIAQTRSHMEQLQSAIRAEDKNLVQKEMETLNEVSRPYAERVMDAALKDAMKGKKIV